MTVGLEGNTDEAIGFLQNHRLGGPWHLCSLIPDGLITARTFHQPQIEAMARFIEDRQGRENLYFHVNLLKDGLVNVKAKKEHIAAATHAHVDIDEQDGLARLRAFRLPPTAIVASGGGYNAYWRFESPIKDLDRVERINRWLVKELGGDPAVTDVSRILRVPGTVNLPTRKKVARGRVAKVAHVV